MVRFHNIGKLTVELRAGNDSEKEWMTDLDDPEFQDTEGTNTLQSNSTKVANWAIQWLKNLNCDKCKVMHVVVVRIQFPVVHLHWIEIGYY